MTRFASATPAGKAAIIAAVAALLAALWTALTMVITLAGIGRLSANVDAVEGVRSIELLLESRTGGRPHILEVPKRAAAVRDHGIGISAKSLSRIFQQFERAEGSECSAGLGLGLYIAEQIVKAHGGRIQVESEEGKGSLFRVTLPV